MSVKITKKAEAEARKKANAELMAKSGITPKVRVAKQQVMPDLYADVLVFAPRHRLTLKELTNVSNQD